MLIIGLSLLVTSLIYHVSVELTQVIRIRYPLSISMQTALQLYADVGSCNTNDKRKNVSDSLCEIMLHFQKKTVLLPATFVFFRGSGMMKHIKVKKNALGTTLLLPPTVICCYC